MNNRQKWKNRRLSLGKVFMATGALVIVFGIILPRITTSLAFNPRIIVGLGIILISAGFAFLVQFWGLCKDMKATERWINEESDERNMLIRFQTGYAAFWVCLGMTYALLLWVSFSDNGSLPKITNDTLWYCLAAVVVISFTVYILGVIQGNKKY